MSLQQLLAQTIKANGPLPLSTYMALCLTHPQYGYYTTRNPIGAPKESGGDFITAPEISQMFGELIGLWAVHEWQARGAPAPFSLVEFGPGNGTLLADALRAAKLRPAFTEAISLHLCETSHALRARQLEKLASYKPNYFDDVAQLPPQPAFIIANEFFDALPINQYRLTDDGWQQRTVTLNADALVFGEGPDTPPPVIAATNSHAWVEYSAASVGIMQGLCAHIKRHGGALLIIDYGYLGPKAGDTLQAVRRHQYTSPLDHPGECDLTAHVDFGTLAREAHAAGCHAEYMTQGEFLGMIGITARAEQLGDNDGLVRLTAPDQMGELFKVLIVNAP